MKTNTDTLDRLAEAPTGRLPAVQTGQALLSLRDSGFDLPTALAEVIDNSIEARAHNVTVTLNKTEKNGKKLVHQIVVTDDGDGMDLDTLHHYPVVGFSTRYGRTDTIGKYGVGAKLAALNFGKRLDVWSRQSLDQPWMHVYFDLDEALQQERDGSGHAGIEAPKATPVPPELMQHLPEKHGTLVLWSKVDRLEDGRRAPDYNGLVNELMKDTARVFREYISNGVSIRVNGQTLLPHDPLFLMAETWADTILSKVAKREDDTRGKPKLQHFAAKEIWTQEILVDGKKAKVTITLYPEAVTRQRGMGGDKLATELRVPENEGCISFMRRGREIAYTNVPRIFGSRVAQSDRFIGIEVSFDPDLDAFFGVRNVKRGVEPQGELRDKLREVLQKHIPSARKELEERWGKAGKAERDTHGEHSPIVTAAASADATMPGSRVPAAPETVIEEELENLARDIGRDSSEEEIKNYVDSLRDLPFVLESVDFPGKQFIDIKLLGNKVIIRLNTRHRFYKEMWHPLSEIAETDPGAVSGDDAVRTARRATEGLTLMILAYGKALSMTEKPHEYDDLTSDWGRFVDTLMGKVKDVL